MEHRGLRVIAASVAVFLTAAGALAQNQAPKPSVRPVAGPQSRGAAAREREKHPAFPWSAKTASPPDRGRSIDFGPQPGDAIRLGDKDGRTEWSVWGATIENFQSYLRSLNAPASSSPDFSISSIYLTGSADDDQARLTAEIQIEIGRDGATFDVPIGLQEANLRPGFGHEGPGEFRLSQSIKRGTAHSVQLSGKGLHTLTLPLVVQVRRQLNQRHLQLTVPAAAGSELSMIVPKKNCEVKPIEGRGYIQKTTISTGTQIDVVGMKGLFDLTWEFPVEEPQTRTVFDVVSQWTLEMDQDRIQLGVRQTIDPKQGNIASVRVRMPSGFRTIAGQQLNVSEAKKYTATDVDPAGFVKVDLRPAGTGRIELRWDLEMALPSFTSTSAPTIILRGFDLEGARLETGDVSINPAEGFHFDYRAGTNVRRVNVSTLGAGLAESAYNYSQQPFRLEIALEEIRPLFTVEPASFVLLSEQRVELTGQFRVQTRRGAVREIALRWPDWKKQGWSIDQLPDDSEVIEGNPRVPAAGGMVRLRLKARRGSDYVLAFRAVRPAPRAGEAFPLSLPTPAVSPRIAGTLVVADAENVKSTLQPRAETAVRPISADAREKLNPPESFRGLRQAAWRIDSETCVFDALVAPQKQQIETESTAKIEVKESHLALTQRITYHVAYERLSEAVIVLPAALQRAEVKFFVGRNEPADEVIPSFTSADSLSGRQARISFFDPRIGGFDLYARYSIPLPQPGLSETSTDVSVPFLHSRDAVFKAMRVELRARDDMEVEVVDETWSPQLADASSTHAWLAAGDRTSIPLRLVQTAAGAGAGVKIAKALLRSVVDVSGAVHTTANYRIERPASSITLTLPTASSDLKFSMDGQEIKAQGVRETRPGSREYRLELGVLSPNPQRILTVDFVDPAGTPCGFISLHRLDAPVFPESTSIGTVMWEVTLPFEQFLFLDPSGFTPEFRWQRDSAFFVRKPTRRAADLGGWLGLNYRSSSEDGSSYAFSRFGSLRTIVVGSMAQSSVIFVGAGLSLFAAFVLFKLSPARTLLALFVFAFAIAVASLWFAEAVRLLLQPALLGFLLALGAAFVDARIQRRRERFLLTAPSAADFVATTAASPSSVGRAFGNSIPQLPVAARPTEELLQQPVSSEIGSHP